MGKRNANKSFRKQERDLICELMEKEGMDEMGLLDLEFIEEILNR